MPRGGTRAGSGRPPGQDPDSLRSLERPETYGEWTELPKSGRTGRVPAWPLPTRTTAPERKLWNRLWKSPQAIMWEELEQHLQVAMYVRRLIEAEERGASSALTSVVLRLADSLGISALGMRSLRWRIVDREKVAREKVAAAQSDPPVVAKRKPGSQGPSRERLRVVRDDIG